MAPASPRGDFDLATRFFSLQQQQHTQTHHEKRAHGVLVSFIQLLWDGDRWRNYASYAYRPRSHGYGVPWGEEWGNLLALSIGLVIVFSCAAFYWTTWAAGSFDFWHDIACHYYYNTHFSLNFTSRTVITRGKWMRKKGMWNRMFTDFYCMGCQGTRDEMRHDRKGHDSFCIFRGAMLDHSTIQPSWTAMSQADSLNNEYENTARHHTEWSRRKHTHQDFPVPHRYSHCL